MNATTTGWFRRLVGCAAFVAGMAAAVSCRATALMGGVAAEAANHFSMVRDSAGMIVALDHQYVADIRAAYNGTFDVVMQQCFGGGFLNDFQAINQPHTFTSASAWNEPSFAQVVRPAIFGSDSVKDFTDAWRANVNYVNARATYVTTLGGNPGVKDRFAPPGVTTGIFTTTTYLEHPQFGSPDPGPGPGANDMRALFTPGAGGNNYAILVAWDRPNDANANDLFGIRADIARVYDMLRNVQNIPVNNIVTLFHGNARGVDVTGFTGLTGDAHPAGENLGGVPNDGPNTLASWQSALAGQQFINPTTGARGIMYGPNDRLFIYNTGHGGEVKRVPRPGMPGMNWLVRYRDGFSFLPELDGNGDTTDPDGLDLMQISTRSLVSDPAIHLTINNVDLGPLASYRVIDPQQTVYDLGGLVQETTFTYQLRVSPTLLATFPDNIEVGLVHPLSPGFAADPELIAAIDLRGGMQELLTVYVIPEPAGILLMIVAAAALLERRRAPLPRRG